MLRRKPAWPLMVGLAILVTLASPWGQAALGAAEERPTVGAPRSGDAVRYRVTETADGATRHWDLVFHWNGTGSVEGRFGAARAVDVVEGAIVPPSGDGGGDATPFRLTYAPGATRPATFETRASGDHRYPLPGVNTTAERGRAVRHYGAHPGWTELCAVRAGWQGARLDALTGRSFAALCPGAAPAGAGHAVLEPVGTDRVDGRTTHGFTARVDHGDRTEALTLWFVDGLPYPARLRLDTEWPDHDPREHPDRATLTLQLEGFTPGPGALLPADGRDPPARRVDARFAAPGRWGVVEGDRSEYAFPPSEAVEALTTDPARASFHDYLRTHPDARVVEFHYRERMSSTDFGGTRYATWTFLFNDASGEGWEAGAVKELGARSGDAAAAWPVQPVRTVRGEPVDLPPLDPAAIPAEAVSVGDALRLWRATHGTGGAELPRVYAALQPGAAGAERVREAVFYAEEYRFTPGEHLFVGHQTYGAQDPGDPAGDGLQYRYVLAGRTMDLRTGAFVVEFDDQYDRTIAPAGAGGRASDWNGEGGVRAPHAPRGIAYPAAVGATLLALVAYYFGGALKAVAARFVAAPLYTRLEKGDVLDNPLRRRILELVRGEPGVHVRALDRRVDCGNGALLYHLEVLTREGLLTRVAAAGYARYYVAGSMPHGEMRRRAVLAAGSHRQIFDAIRERPGLSQREVAERVGVSAPAVHYAVKKLEKAGLVRRERRGRRVGLHPVAGDAGAGE